MQREGHQVALLHPGASGVRVGELLGCDRESGHEPLHLEDVEGGGEVVGREVEREVQVDRHAGVTAQDHRDAADDHVVDARVVESVQEIQDAAHVSSL